MSITTSPRKNNVLHQISLKHVKIAKKSPMRGIIKIQVRNDFMINSEDPKKLRLRSLIKQSNETMAVVD